MNGQIIIFTFLSVFMLSIITLMIIAGVQQRNTEEAEDISCQDLGYEKANGELCVSSNEAIQVYQDCEGITNVTCKAIPIKKMEDAKTA